MGGGGEILGSGLWRQSYGWSWVVVDGRGWLWVVEDGRTI